VLRLYPLLSLRYFSDSMYRRWSVLTAVSQDHTDCVEPGGAGTNVVVPEFLRAARRQELRWDLFCGAWKTAE